jgi:hypothetical protein
MKFSILKSSLAFFKNIFGRVVGLDIARDTVQVRIFITTQ